MVCDNIYDFAVLGGGITGLTSSLLIKKESRDKKVILLEKNNFLGGMAKSILLDGYPVDSVYMFPNLDYYLDYLGIKFEYEKIGSAFYDIKLIDNNETFTIKLPPDMNKLGKTLSDAFPDEKHNIKKFLDYFGLIEKQFLNLKSALALTDIIKMLIFSRELVFSGNVTLTKLLKKFKFKNPLLIKILESFAGLSQLPPQRVNSLVPILALVNLVRGTYRQSGSFDQLINSMHKHLNESNVEISLNTRVENITREAGLFNIKTAKNSNVITRTIINTIDSKIIYNKIIDRKAITDAYYEKIKKTEMTLSVFILRLLVKSNEKYDTDIGQRLYYGGSDTFLKLFNLAKSNLSTLLDDTFHFATSLRLLDKIKNIYSLELLAVPVSYIYWEKTLNTGKKNFDAEKQRWENFYLSKLEKHFDEKIRDKIISKSIITPVQFGALFGSSEGAVYDMSQVCSQAGMNRIGFKAPVKNFYHLKQIHGVYGSFFQAFEAVDFILGGRINKFSYKFGQVK